MSDLAAGILGLLVILLLVFIGFWFGIATLGWIILTAIVIFVGAALLVRFTRG
jgi:hypothetical protein